MRKIIIIGLTFLLLVSSSLAAYTYPDFFREGVSFAPTSTRIEGMGGAGISTSTGLDSLYMNPANLANGRFSLYLPAVTVTVFNAKGLLDSEIIQDLVDGVEPDVAMGGRLLDTIVVDKGDVFTSDIAFGFAGGGFGLGLNIQEQIHNVDTGTDTNFVVEVNAAASIGLGINLDFIPDVLSVDVGATVRPTYKAFTQKIGAPGIINTAFDEDEDFLQKFLGENQLSAGYAVPMDVGVNVNLPVGLSLSGVMRNINGTYTMRDYTEAGTWVNEMLEFVSQETIYTGTSTAAGAEKEIIVPISYDIGFGWTPNLGGLSAILRPSLAIDLVDVGLLAQEMDDNEQAFWNHLRAGAEVKILSAIDVRAGINKGYMSVGAGFDLFVIHVDAAYYWREAGENIGDSPIDALSLRFNIGLDG